ncbi:hypothetical protein GmHk_12G034584 [Glycine max]|nr:hypothetical protein GmHk_12G034584 [Glycine max]
MGLGLYTMSYIDFKKLINSLKYKSFKCLLYRDPRKSPSRGLKPLNFDFDILQLAKDVFGFDVVEVYVDQGVIDTSSKNLNDVEDDEVVVIDGVEAEVDKQGLVEVQVQVEREAGVQGDIEAKIQVDEQDLMEVQVQVQHEAGVEGEMEVMVEDMVDGDVEAEEDDDDNSDYSEVSDNGDFDELYNANGSDDEGDSKVRFPQFKVPENDDVEFEVDHELDIQSKGFDGCFLKGEYGGQLLSALAKDGNNQMFPIAYAVVESENYSPWNWFVDLLIADLEEAWKDLEKLNLGAWTRYAFKLNAKCDLQVNNMCEAFNNVIMEYRDKPIITLLEEIRFYISFIIVKLRTIMMRKSIVLSTYSFIIFPCNRPNLWPPLQRLVMLPPVMRSTPKRPKKARNKGNDELKNNFKLPRQSKSIVCKKCGKLDHNKRTCKGKTTVDRNIPKRGNKNLKRQSTFATNVVTKKQKNVSCTSGTTSARIQGVKPLHYTNASRDFGAPSCTTRNSFPWERCRQRRALGDNENLRPRPSTAKQDDNLALVSVAAIRRSKKLTGYGFRQNTTKTTGTRRSRNG